MFNRVLPFYRYKFASAKNTVTVIKDGYTSISSINCSPQSHLQHQKLHSHCRYNRHAAKSSRSQLQQQCCYHSKSPLSSLIIFNQHLNNIRLSSTSTSLPEHDTSEGFSAKYQNRLRFEKSPYLLRHSNDPVDWYVWGEEAFIKASQEEKPVFLSIGYFTCHGCRLMQKELFENKEIAQLLNENFVCIKVDKEERPDVDRIYTLFLEATTDESGWPLNVWLTPDRKPITAGSLYSAEQVNNEELSFKQVLLQVIEEWQCNREEVVNKASNIIEELKKATFLTSRYSHKLPEEDPIHACFTSLYRSYDITYAGFGAAPKFPRTANLEFLMKYYAYYQDTVDGIKAKNMLQSTLKMMSNGGIHDHIGQGFFHYSTDNMWHVPYFVKTIYDQAQLAVLYMEAYQLTKDTSYADVARSILNYVARDLSHPEGGFYSSEDNESYPSSDSTEKKEGAYCLWTKEEINSLLSEQIEGTDLTYAEVFCSYFTVRDGGNINLYQDDNGDFTNQNILYIGKSKSQIAKDFKITEDELQQILLQCKFVLFQERRKRPRPQIDDKMICSWNGKMVSAFAKAGQIFGEEKYINRAIRGGHFILKNMFDKENEMLYRSCYSTADKRTTQRSEPIKGFVDDYAGAIGGFIDLYETTFDQHWLHIADRLSIKQYQYFYDMHDGGFFTTRCISEDKLLIMQLKEHQDGAEASPNALSGFNYYRLHGLLKHNDDLYTTNLTIGVFAKAIEHYPRTLPALLSLLLTHKAKLFQILIAGDLGSEETDILIKTVNSEYLFNKVIHVLGADQDSFIYNKLPTLKQFGKQDDQTVAYICHNHVCIAHNVAFDSLKLLLPKLNSKKLNLQLREEQNNI